MWNRRTSRAETAGIALLVLVLAALSGCQDRFFGSVEVTLASNFEARTVAPTLDMSIDSYEIILSGPGPTFLRTIGGGETTTEFGSVVPGEWTVTVNARNAEAAGAVTIATDTEVVEVFAGTTATAHMVVVPLSGTGTLEVGMSWPANTVAAPAIEATLRRRGGTAQQIPASSFALDTSGDPHTASYSGSWDAGYYTMVLSLSDGATAAWSWVEAVRIISGQSSRAAYEIALVPTGGLELVLSSDLQNPISIVLSGAVAQLAEGTDMTVTAVCSVSPDTYAWYLDGQEQVAQTGQTITVGDGLAVGDHTLNVVVEMATTEGAVISSEGLSFSVRSAAEGTRILSFGLVTDSHWCDRADPVQPTSAVAGPRYFTGGLAKLESFANAMNDAGVDFIAHLGDLSDNPANAALPADAKRLAALQFLEEAEARLALFQGPRYHVFGNHDTDQTSKADVLTKLTNTGIPAGATYYSFDAASVHFVVLDADFRSDGTAYAASNFTWDDANIPAAEAAWLEADLGGTALPTVVLTHQLLNPQETTDLDYNVKYCVKNAAAVRSVLEASGKVVAVLSGHKHDGGSQIVNGIPYVVLQASAAYGSDASAYNQYATVDVYADGLNMTLAVTGNGMQRSYVVRTTVE